MCDHDCITQAELEAALYRLRNIDSCITSVKLFADVKAHREPVWVAGDVVRDAAGTVWMRSNVGEQWRRPGSDGFYGDSSPARPLKHLVEK